MRPLQKRWPHLLFSPISIPNNQSYSSFSLHPCMFCRMIVMSYKSFYWCSVGDIGQHKSHRLSASSRVRLHIEKENKLMKGMGKMRGGSYWNNCWCVLRQMNLHEDEGPNEELTPFECCSQTKYGHPQAAFQRRWDVVGPVGYLPYLGSFA